MVSRTFITDFAYCANYYQWSAETIEEVKQQTRGNAELMRYWQELAAAHRAGYRQTKKNNWERLECWKQRK